MLKVVKYFEFTTQDDADAFADFQQASECDTPECTSVEIERLYDKRKQKQTS